METVLSELVRKLVGYRSLRKVSEESGVAPSYISGIINGKRKNPSALILKKLTDSKANPQNGVTFEDLMVAAGYQNEYVGSTKMKNVYIIFNGANNYSTSVRLTEEQAKAIEWFIDEILDRSGDDQYTISLPEDCPCADLTEGGNGNG